MEIFKNIFSPFEDRARSLFYRSFIATWLIWNWKIVFTVIFYKSIDLKGKSIINHISDEYLNVYDCLIYPLIYSIGLFLIIPLVDYLFSWYKTTINSKQIENNLEVGGKFSVSGKKYNALKIQYDDVAKNIIESENTIEDLQNNYNKLETEFEKHKAYFIKLEEDFKKLSNRDKIENVFEGYWKVHYKDHNRGVSTDIIDIRIHLYDYYIINFNEEKKYIIKLFQYDDFRKKVSFVKFDLQKKEHVVVELEKESNELYRGTENELVNVEYRRVPVNLK